MPTNQNLLKLTVLDRRYRHDGCEAIQIAMNGLVVVEPAPFTAALDSDDANEAMNAIVARVRESLPELFGAEPGLDRGVLQCAQGFDCGS